MLAQQALDPRSRLLSRLTIFFSEIPSFKAPVTSYCFTVVGITSHYNLSGVRNPRLFLVRTLLLVLYFISSALFPMIPVYTGHTVSHAHALGSLVPPVSSYSVVTKPYQGLLLKKRLCSDCHFLFSAVSRTTEYSCFSIHLPTSKTIILLFEASHARLNLPETSYFMDPR